MIKSMKIDVEKKADSVRKEGDVTGYGIDDIFTLIDAQGIDVIRYPFGKDTVLGFSTRYLGKRVIVTNSSEILSREIYTAAHELGHILFDFPYEHDMHIDCTKPQNNTNNVLDFKEQRAYAFADSLLMPEALISKYIKLVLNKSYRALNMIDVIKIQTVFNVSYSALVMRLNHLNFITDNQKTVLFDDKEKNRLYTVFQRLNLSDALLQADERIHVPSKYLRYVFENYHNDHIPVSSLKKVLTMIGSDDDILEIIDTNDYEKVNE